MQRIWKLALMKRLRINSQELDDLVYETDR